MEKLETIPDFVTPIAEWLKGFSKFLNEQIIDAQLKCRLNQPHFLISAKNPCVHYVKENQLHLLSDDEKAVWYKLHVKLNQLR